MIQHSSGKETNVLAEMVDAYPTLAALAGLPDPRQMRGSEGINGTSLVPAIADPTNTTGQLHTIYSNIAAVFASTVEWNKSYHYAHQSIILRPNFAKGHSRMATALMAMKMYPDARQAYRCCLEYDPAN